VLAVLAGVVTLTVVSFGIEAVADPLLMKLFPESLLLGGWFFVRRARRQVLGAL
jgi:hypothetical protein